MSDLFRDIVPAILQTKKDVLDNEKDYNAFVVNKALSFHMDCILQANQMNMLPNLDGKLQFQYLLNSTRGYKRPYQKWHKRETMENLDAVKEYFNYSNEKAKEALSILSDAQIEQIKKEIDKGGLNVRNRRFDRGEAT
jgi:anti-sigma28 factor (negative regulator of flagellin synthesis)